MSANLAGLHDRSAASASPSDTWIVDTVALSENPVPPAYDSSHNWIGRLNWGYGRTGTLPNSNQYNEMAQRAAAYVAGSRGCHKWTIGNEPNLRREWPNGVPIYPWHYAACFKLCRQAIRALPGHETDEVLIAASGPWNDECKYEGNPNGDWIKYFTDVIDLLAGEIDGFSLHAYTHGYDVNLVTSTARMDAPFQDRFYNFRTYQDYCDAVPLNLTHLPAFITEANGDGPWRPVGLIPAMLGEIDYWNQSNNAPLIHCVCFYRYSDEDEGARFEMGNKPAVMAEYQQGVARGYVSPSTSAPTPQPPTPKPPTPPQPMPPDEKREIDPRLVARGVHFEYVTVAEGQPYWRIIKAEWHPNAAQTVGPDHHILGQVLKADVQTAGVRLRVDWPSGTTSVTSKADDPNASYNYDFAMSPSLNEFAICVDDGLPSDRATGIGMGMMGNPNEHTSTWITFEYTIAGGEPEPPIPPGPGQTMYVLPLIGANIRAEPDPNSARVGGVPYAEAVTVDGAQQGSDGYQWQHATYQGNVGWIRGDLLSEERPQPPTPPQPSPSGDLVHPLPGSVITNRFYQRPQDYVQFNLPGHNGTDFGGKPIGTPVRCAAAGVVLDKGFDKEGYGNWVKVNHPALAICTLYAHLDSIAVSKGQSLAVGQSVGALGTTGNSTGPHLHFEVRRMNPDGSYNTLAPMAQGCVDPETFCCLNGLKL